MCMVKLRKKKVMQCKYKKTKHYTFYVLLQFGCIKQQSNW